MHSLATTACRAAIVMERLKKLYHKHFGCEPVTICPILGSGSDRSYMRLGSPAGSAIGVIGMDTKENYTFIYIDRLMREKGFNAPEVYGASDDGTAYLQQDLGDTCLLPLLHTAEGDNYVREIMQLLPHLQFELNPDLDKLYPVSVMTRDVALRDLHYFKYCFLKAVDTPIDEQALDEDFNRLLDDLWGDNLQGAVYRDCQSRNIMIHAGQPWWIDFQSMRKGPVLYDVASFLWQARAQFSDSERVEFSNIYYDNLPVESKPARESFHIQLRKMAMLRTLQVLGAYGLRGLTQRKAHFIVSIPAALANAVELFDNGLSGAYPQLEKSVRHVAGMKQFQPGESDGRLHVQVFSFSYKRGYPQDFSGNGGGFMFDCRAMHNPGRYDEYKQLTGRDTPVITFLEERGEVQPFLQAAEALTFPAVERYIARGFSSLQIGFGCTGGRHRSVYCAEHLAHHIAEKFGKCVKVTLCHREQGINEVLT